MRKNHKRKGAILALESMLYIVLLIILVSVGLYAWRSHVDSARRETAHADCVTIASAVSQFNYETKTMPRSLNELTRKGGSGSELGPWLTELKKDPWGNDYRFLVDDTNKNFIVYSTVNGKGSGTPRAEKRALANAGFVGVYQHFEYKTKSS